MSDSNYAIVAKNIGKQYLLGGAEQRYDSFRDLMSGLATLPLRKFKRLAGTLNSDTEKNLFWALRDINFNVPQGQVTGVIGRNGAGKSTLLKVLSRITSPTEGEVAIRGRVASLLEVGSGFHPELTGRENIYMNASILGMRRQEVHRKLDDIVEFAEVERFIDTPVKRYSSGMYVRLAFSVAAHVDPDVLLVDEVLAVGDAKFQQRCIGKLSEVGQQGRTVMFVSHNMGLIQDLCSHTIYLRNGSIENYGLTAEVLPQYLQEGSEQTGIWEASDADSTLRQLAAVDEHQTPIQSIAYDEDLTVRVDYRPDRSDRNFVLALRVTDELGRDVFTSWDSDSSERSTKIGQDHQAWCQIPKQMLRPGRYFLTAMIRKFEHGFLASIDEASLELEVTNIACPMNADRFGVVLPLLQWDHVEADSMRHR